MPPSTENATAGKKPRQTQDQRSAATRERLIRSAIDCLYRYGYAATTTNLISDRAGVSRGAMQHQFGTRVELMLAVAGAILAERDKVLADTLETFEAGVGRFVGMTDATWEVTRRPSSIAFLEIMLAGRSDPELQAKFSVLANESNRLQQEEIWAVSERCGITDRPTVEAMTQLHRAALIGLSLQYMYWNDEAVVRPGLDLLLWYKGLLTARLLAPEGGVEAAVAAYVAAHPIAGAISEPSTILKPNPKLGAGLEQTSQRKARRAVRPTEREPRGEETRAKAIQAAIVCLEQYGYAATTTMLVAEQAGISRGAMQQQFPTRLDLLLGVVEHIVDEQNAFFASEIARLPQGKPRFMAVTEIMWLLYSRPSGVAISELMLASRSDPALSEACLELTAQVVARSSPTQRLSHEAGVHDENAVLAMRILHRSALRGLAIFRMLSPDPDHVAPGLELLRWYKGVLTEHLFDSAAKTA